MLNKHYQHQMVEKEKRRAKNTEQKSELRWETEVSKNNMVYNNTRNLIKSRTDSVTHTHTHTLLQLKRTEKNVKNIEKKIAFLLVLKIAELKVGIGNNIVNIFYLFPFLCFSYIGCTSVTLIYFTPYVIYDYDELLYPKPF